jgi:anti-sigma factor RsiW
MNIDEALLRAYVDGDLDAHTRQHVDSVVAHSAPLQAQLQALRASCLPYRAAHEAQSMPAPPQRLVATVQALTAVASAPNAAHQMPAPTPRMPRRALLGGGLAVAASFAAGLLMPWRPGLPTSGTHGATGATSVDAPWVQAIATYHALYVRETVDAPADSPQRLPQLAAGFGERERSILMVPDLSSVGLAFKRIQRLGFGPQPLLQMVYLPASGRPTAVCMLANAQADSLLVLRTLEGMSVGSWTQRGLAYVVVSDEGLAATSALSQGLMEGRFAALRG